MTMPQTASDLDHAELVKLAEQALKRPGSYMAFDDRWYNTHGCVMAWADRGDDVLAESNYLTALDMLNGAVAHDETGASEARGDDVVDTSASHWGYGSVRELFVRVFDEHGEYTPAFIEAARIHGRLENYPILDESDFSEREYKQWEDVMEDALSDATTAHWEVDESTDEAVIYYLVTCTKPYDDRLMDYCGYPAESVDWDRVQEVYDQARDEYLGWLAERQWAAIVAEHQAYELLQPVIPGL